MYSSASYPSPPKLGASSSRRRTRKGRADSSNDENERGRSRASSSDVAAIAFEPEVISLSDTEDELKQSPRRPATQRRLMKRKRADNSQDERDSGSDSLPEVISAPIVWKRKGKAKPGKQKHVVVQDSDSVEEVVPKRRKLFRRERPPTPVESDLMEEVDEDSKY